MVAKSSIEAKYFAIAFSTIEIVWLQQLLHELGAPLCNRSIVLYDNLSATFTTANRVTNITIKHIHLDFYCVQEKLDVNKFRVRHVLITEQHDDIFTNPLTCCLFNELKSKLLVFPKPSTYKRVLEEIQ